MYEIPFYASQSTKNSGKRWIRCLYTLHRTALVFSCYDYDHARMLTRLSSTPRIELPTCLLKVRFEHNFDFYHSLNAPTTALILTDVIEMPLLAKLKIRSKEINFRETWIRIHKQLGSDEGIVDVWPVVDPAKKDRTTRKIVELH